MRNFTEEHLHVIENVGCRCKICEGSIFKSQKRQDVDAIVHYNGPHSVDTPNRQLGHFLR